MKNTIYKKEKLSKYSWFNLGGPAEILFKPNSIDELKNFLINKEINNKNIFILGAGSNTLFRDTGFNGFVIKLGKEFTNIKLLEDNKIEVGAATLDKKLADFACQNSISGLEFLSCIPGSIGGAVTMNSGCYQKDISKIFYSLQAIDLNGNVKVFKKDDIKFFYRGNNLDSKLRFCKASFFPNLISSNNGFHTDRKSLNQVISASGDEATRLGKYSFEYFIAYTPDQNGNNSSGRKKTGTNNILYTIYSCGCNETANKCNAQNNVIVPLEAVVTLVN